MFPVSPFLLRPGLLSPGCRYRTAMRIAEGPKLDQLKSSVQYCCCLNVNKSYSDTAYQCFNICVRAYYCDAAFMTIVLIDNIFKLFTNISMECLHSHKANHGHTLYQNVSNHDLVKSKLEV